MRINLPVIAEADVIVVGGSVAAVRAALELKKQHYEVFCVNPRTYWGEDIAAPFNYWPETPDAELFPDYPQKLPTPMAIKARLEAQLIAAEIPFLYQTYPVRAGRDRRGNWAGLVLVNRSGFVAVTARVALDGSSNLALAKLCGGKFAPFKPGIYPVSRYLIGAPAPEKSNLTCRRMPVDVVWKNQSFPAYRATGNFEFKTGNWFEQTACEIKMRRLGWSAQQVWSADACDFSSLNTPLLQEPDATFPVIPASRPDAVELAVALADWSRAGKIQDFADSRRDYSAEAVAFGGSKRYVNCPKVSFELNSLPLHGRYDLLVAGGGTCGAPAAIAGAREAARVLCVEASPQLGGLSTSGRIGHYDGVESRGFSQEIDQRVADLGGENAANHREWNIEWKQHYFLTAAAQGSVSIWFNSMVVGALRHGNLVVGALVATPGGVVAVESAALVDATGNAEVAQRAGAETEFADQVEPACQGAGVAPAEPGVFVAHTDYLFIADSDQEDLTRAFAAGRAKFGTGFDLAQLAGTRERCRVVGDLRLNPEDFMLQRTYSDTIAVVSGNFRTRGFTVHPIFGVYDPGDKIWSIHLPFRALLPKTLDGILVIGSGLSAHRDALPMLRRISDRHNLGFAAGLAGAMAAKHNRSVRGVDMRELQRMLGAIGILPPETMTEIDGFASGDQAEQRLAEMFRQPALAILNLKKEFASQPTPELATLLALLGDATGRKVLLSAIERSDWDEGWNFRGEGQRGMALSALDIKLMALSHIVNPDSWSVVLHKLENLTPDMAFSHFRVIALNLFKLCNADAVPYLEALLCAPGMRGHLGSTIQEVVASVKNAADDNTERNAQLKEFYLLKSLAACDPTERYALAELSRCAEHAQYLFAGVAAK